MASPTTPDDLGITPEMRGYLVAIARERGYVTMAEISENLGDMMREAVRRMDRLVTECLEQKTWRAQNVRHDMAEGAWLHIQAARIMGRQASRIASY